MGLRMPEVVSQRTAATWVMPGSPASAWSRVSGSLGTSSGVSCTSTSRPMTRQIFTMRVP
jgi:hypothetical protein